MKRKENVILTGFMGCGKTTIGVKLSYRLRMTLEDTDKLIERREKKSIGEIFAQDGEEAFRKMETALLKEIGDRNYTQIISVGGGTPISPENRRILQECGTVVYLEISPGLVYERLKEDTTRPLLQGGNVLSKITALMEERRRAYEECADIVVRVDGKEMEDILEEIVDGLDSMKAKWRQK
nr:shikimate kinase [uncultured Acetatifactor sp.]